jgi:hypothetical protein
MDLIHHLKSIGKYKTSYAATTTPAALFARAHCSSSKLIISPLLHT